MNIKKILLIDDSPENIFLIKECLGEDNFTFLESTDSTKGFDLAKNENPDLIILDLMMPNIDGFELCAMLKNDSDTIDIPIIIISAFNNSEMIKKGLEAGATDFIGKPFDCIELLARIKSALRIAENKKLSIELERNNFAVKAYRLANHKIKQPLTVLKLANTAIKKELSKDSFEIQSLRKRIDYIDKAVNEINEILNDLERIFKEESTKNLH
ncbi:MAG: response regulator [Ignavibacterium sp.]|nr:response regulator [Ignavibacterium sp.]MDW8374686.1 response regulator [Ignavibacteriales bacterium]